MIGEDAGSRFCHNGHRKKEKLPNRENVIPKGAIRPEESTSAFLSVKDERQLLDSSGRIAPFGMTSRFSIFKLVRQRIAPKRVAHEEEIMLNKGLFLGFLGLNVVLLGTVLFVTSRRRFASTSTTNVSNVRVLVGHAQMTRGFNPLEAVAFSPDGKTLASGGGDTVRLWDVATAQPIRLLAGHSGKVHGLAFSPDGRLLADGSAATANIWDARTGRLLRRLRIQWVYPSFEFYAVAFSPDSRMLATGSGGNGNKPFQVKLWSIASGKLLRTMNGHRGQIRSVAFSPDGRTLLSASYDATIRHWDVATGKSMRRWKGGGGYFSAVFSPDGKTVAAASNDSRVELLDMATGGRLGSFRGQWAPIRSLAFTRDGKTLIAGGNDGRVRVWDIATGDMKRTLDARRGPGMMPDNMATQFDHSDNIASIAVSPDGALVASASFDEALQLWSLK